MDHGTVIRALSRGEISKLHIGVVREGAQQAFGEGLPSNIHCL